MSDFVELGNGPAPMRVTLVDGRDNALGLERRDDTGPVAWPSAPTLRLRDAAGVVVFDAAGVLSNTDTVASWTVPDAVVSLGTARPVRGQIVLDGEVVFAGTVVVLDGWSGVCPSVDVGGAGVVVGPPGPAGPAGQDGAGSATLEQILYTMTAAGRALVVVPVPFWLDWTLSNTPDPEPVSVPDGADVTGIVAGGSTWMRPNQDSTFTIGGEAHGGWEFDLPLGVYPYFAIGGIRYCSDGTDWYWTDGTAAPAIITGGAFTFENIAGSGWLIDAGGDWYKVNPVTGAWIITTPPSGVDPQYAYPIPETGDTLAWDGTGWHHLTPAGVWSTVAGGPTTPTSYTGDVTYTDTEVWIGDATPGDGRWWSPGGGWRDDHRNYAYTQMWGLTDGALWTDGTDWWRTISGGWWNTPAPDPLLGFDQFTGSIDNLVGYNSQDGYWGYSTNGGPWVLGLRERIYLLEQNQTTIENRLTALENP